MSLVGYEGPLRRDALSRFNLFRNVRFSVSNGVYICNLCETEGKGPGERFKVPADEIGVALMKQHLRDEHNVRA